MKNIIFILLFIPGIVAAQDGPQIFYGPRGTGTGFDSTFMDYRLLALEARPSWLANGTSLYLPNVDTTKFKLGNLYISPVLTLGGSAYTTVIGGNTSTFSTYVIAAATSSQGTITVFRTSNPSAIYMLGSGTPYIALKTATTANIAHISTYGSWFGLNTAFPSDEIGMSALNTQGLRADTIIAPLRVVDTTNMVVHDTLNYIVREHEIAMTSKSGNANQKTGSIVYEFAIDDASPCWKIRFAADSANAVRILQITCEARGGRAGSYSTYNTSVTTAKAASNALAVTYWRGSVSDKTIKVAWYDPNPAGARGLLSDYQWELPVMGNSATTRADAAWSRVQVRVTYGMPPANFSTTPITLAF